MGIVLQTWALHRLSALPAHAIIVFERAEGRVRIWREKNAEPPIVLRTIVHVDAVPTAISSGSDAYWLPALQRWASPSEVARLFGLKAKHSAARALQSRFVSDRTAVVCAGKAVHADSEDEVQYHPRTTARHGPTAGPPTFTPDLSTPFHHRLGPWR